MTDLTQYLDEAKAKIRERREESEELDRLRVENEELKQLIRETVRGSDAPKPIDWSQVAECVPVKVWDDRGGYSTTLYQTEDMVDFIELSDRVSLITGIDIAWKGGECPLPEGVEYVATLREGSKTTVVTHWDHCQPGHAGDIISFRVTGIADGWTEEVGE